MVKLSVEHQVGTGPWEEWHHPALLRLDVVVRGDIGRWSARSTRRPDLVVVGCESEEDAIKSLLESLLDRQFSL